jgi:hypothetical protein
MNYIGATRLPMPAMRTDGTVFPQTVDGQNVEIGVEHRGEEFV